MPAHVPKHTLSLSMLKANLVELCDGVIEHRQKYEREHREILDERNGTIVEMMEAGFPVTTLSRLTKLSRQQLYRIQSGRAEE